MPFRIILKHLLCCNITTKALMLNVNVLKSLFKKVGKYIVKSII